MDERELTAEERAEIERISAELADPATWVEPPPGLEDRVVAAVSTAVAQRPPGRAQRRRRYLVAAAVAAAVVAVGLAVGVPVLRADRPDFTAALSGTELAPGVSGEASMTRTASGWRIELSADGLPRRSGGEFYEAWLKRADGVLVPIGTFNDAREVTLWAGVGPADFGLLTVTREVADGNQASSGEVVLAGRPRR